MRINVQFSSLPVMFSQNIYVSKYFSENRVMGTHLVLKVQALLGIISPHLGYNLKQVFHEYVPQEISLINWGSMVLITQLLILGGCTTYLRVSFRQVINTRLAACSGSEGFPQRDPAVPRLPADTQNFHSKQFLIHCKSILHQLDPDISCLSHLEKSPLF